jgi:MscS family membrane protein
MASADPSVESQIIHRHVAGLAIWQWSTLGVLVLIGVVASLLTNLIVRLSLKPLAKNNKISQILTKALRRAASVFVFPYALTLGLDTAELSGVPETHVKQALAAVQIVGYVLILIAGWDVISEQVAKRSAGQNNRADRLLIPVTRKLIRALIIGCGALVALATLTNINLAALIASLGIGGLVVALAAKDSIENVFGSITILFDTPFAIGDWVRIDKVDGVIEEINLRSTRIRTFEDTLITLPNANLIRAAVENFGARRVRRQKLSIKFDLASPPDKLEQLEGQLRAYLLEMESVQGVRSVVQIDGIDPLGINLLIVAYFEADSQASELELRNELLLEVLREAHGLGLKLSSSVSATAI